LPSSRSLTRDGEGRSRQQLGAAPIILGQERLIPGFEAHLLGIEAGGKTEFDLTFPDDYQETELAGKQAHFAVELKELREKVLPELDDDFLKTLGDFADLDALRVDITARLERNALDRARHGFADRIIDYAVANSTLALPDVLVDQEVEVMHDEFRATLARQGIGEEAYLKAVDKTEANLHGEFRPGAEKRVRTLLVLSKVADAEGVAVRSRRDQAEVARGRERYADRGSWPTSIRIVAARTSGARSGAAASSSSSSTSGWPPTPSMRRCRTWRTRRHPRSRAARPPPPPATAPHPLPPADHASRA
jgi:trigger factor